MSKRNRAKNAPTKPKWHQYLDNDTKHSIWAILSFAVSAILILAYFGKAGMVGDAVQRALMAIFGEGFFLVALAFFLAGLSFIFAVRDHLIITTIIGGVVFLASSLGLADTIFGAYTGGYVGFILSLPFLRFFGFWAALIILGALFVASFLIMLNVSLKPRKKDKSSKPEIVSVPAVNIPQPLSAARPNVQASKEDASKGENENENEESGGIFPKIFGKSAGKKISHGAAASLHAYTPPPLDLLEDDKGTPSSGDIKANANIIKRTLQNFGIDVEMSEVNVGPSVTQYTLKPAEGIKLSRITSLQSDLALALAAHPLRMEAPIPGKSLVGIEVPNRSIALVGLRSIIGMEEFKAAQQLTFAIGRDVSGKAIIADIARMPHLLIAGATGSGKSITIHTLIVSLLYKNSPEFLRFLMVDPKRVELSAYQNIPHLLAPVITDAKKTIIALRWAVREMERRYEKLSEMGTRDINSYNTEMLKEKTYNEILPNVVIIIDELADLMAAYPREMEASIVRLAQMSRAVGIHLVVSTQRPSVEVITGLIKANITARIALQVASGVDSRTILDMSGAEKLLGNGDMLYLAGDTSKPRRIQAAFISEKEVKKVTTYLKDNTEEFTPETIDLDMKLPAGEPGSASDFMDDGGVDDELYEEAKKLVIEAGKASASYLQRRLRIGYARAASILDMLEEHGVIGPGDGAKPREVLMKKDATDRLIEDFEAEKEQEEKLAAKLEKKEKPPHSEAKGNEDVPYTNFDF